MNKFMRIALFAAPLAFVGSHAFAADGITSALAAVDLSGVSALVGAAALIIVGVALVFKGPAIAKRVIRGL